MLTSCLRQHHFGTRGENQAWEAQIQNLSQFSKSSLALIVHGYGKWAKMGNLFIGQSPASPKGAENDLISS